jgi:hypothetical protein
MRRSGGLRSWPVELGRDELIRYVPLSSDDRCGWSRPRAGRGTGGMAIQLYTLPWLGFVPDDVAAVPAAAANLAVQLGIPIADLAGYGARKQTYAHHGGIAGTRGPTDQRAVLARRPGSTRSAHTSLRSCKARPCPPRIRIFRTAGLILTVLASCLSLAGQADSPNSRVFEPVAVQAPYRPATGASSTKPPASGRAGTSHARCI